VHVREYMLVHIRVCVQVCVRMWGLGVCIRGGKSSPLFVESTILILI